MAQFAAELERYGEAVQIYEGVARQSVENNLLKYSAKGYLLNAGICQLCSAALPAERIYDGCCVCPCACLVHIAVQHVHAHHVVAKYVHHLAHIVSGMTQNA